MQDFLNSPFHIGGLRLANRLIQGPLAGFSCAPFRQLFYQHTPPAYCMSEMISAHDVLDKHLPDSRYLYRAPEERVLCYQLSGNHPNTLAKAAHRVQALGADLIDLNAGCPKPKIRKKGAGSALLDDPEHLFEMVRAMREAMTIPLTVKIRISNHERDLVLAEGIQQAGADALTVHGRLWTDDYDTPCDFSHIARIKAAVTIPVIANGDISCHSTLANAVESTGCDAYMIARAGSGHPWLYQDLLGDSGSLAHHAHDERVDCFMRHLNGLADLESEHQAVLQSKSLVRYYFKHVLCDASLRAFYALDSLNAIELYLNRVCLDDRCHQLFMSE